MTRPTGWWQLTLLFLALLGGKGAFGDGLPWQPSGNEGTFLMMSDIHFDPYADPSLAKKLAAAPVEQWESILETSNLTAFCPYGKDTNYPLFKSTMQQVAALGPYDYALVSGDFISHHFKDDFKKRVGGDDKAYQAFVLKTVIFVTREVRKAIADAPAYFCLGNNDSDYDDYGGLIPDSPFLPTLAQEWGTVAKDPQAVKDFSQGGYCVVPHPTLPGHEIVILNDVFWSYKYDPYWAFKDGNKFGPDGPQEKAELKWLAKVMADAKARGEKVTLLTHMPPGLHGRNASEHPNRAKPQKTFYDADYLWPFLNILASDRDLVDAEFCGHTHLDDFRVVQDRGGKPVFFTHICPAVSPIHNNNPGFQVMLYDKGNGTLEDMATYYVPLPENPKVVAAAMPPWQLEYSFRDAYGYKTYDFNSLKALAQAIENDPAVRQKYIDFADQESKEEPPVNGDTWRFFSCAHMNLDPDSYKGCE